MPPKTTSKMNAVARQELGKPRECRTCGDVKDVSMKTFSLNNKGKRGWSTQCRVCDSVEKSVEAVEVQTKIVPKVEDNYAEMIEEMYFLHYSNRDHARKDEIAAALAAEVHRLNDKGDKEASFELFIDIVKPLIAGWMEPGAIHADIKKGLLSTHLRTLIIATRYSAKSTLTGIYVAWEIFLDPLIKIIVISRGSKLAARMLRTVRRVFIENCPVLQHLRPSEDCLDNAEQFQVPQSLQVATGGVTLTSLGMGSNLPGFRSDLTIGDDVEGPADDTPEKVVELEESLNELHMINPKGRKILLGTYQTEFSLYAKLADLTDSDGVPVWEHHRACMFEEDTIDGKLLIHSRWAGMFTDQDGIDWRRGVTARAWRLHVLLIADPSILNERPLKIADLPVVQGDPRAVHFPLSIRRTNEIPQDLPRWSAPKGDNWYNAETSGEPTPYAITVMAVDPASGLAGRDAIGVAVLGITASGFGVIRHLEGVRAANKGLAMRRVATIAKDFNASVLVVEEMADGLFGETLEGELVLMSYPMTVEKVTTGQQNKGKRIVECLAPPMGAGRLCILESVARSDHGGEFVQQLVRISYDGRTGSKRTHHDDIVDALAHAAFRVKTSLISDVADNIAGHRQEQLDRYVRVPLRYGGLGADTEDHAQTNRLSMSRGADTGMSMGEALIQEDEVLIALQERRDRFQEVINDDLMRGRGADPSMVKKVRALTATIEELKGTSVL